jgi:hypothetical protein
MFTVRLELNFVLLGYRVLSRIPCFCGPLVHCKYKAFRFTIELLV